MSRFDTVVFDLGGVLIDWNPRYLFRQLSDDAAAVEHFLAEICSPEWNERQDAGRNWAEATAVLRVLRNQHGRGSRPTTRAGTRCSAVRSPAA